MFKTVKNRVWAFDAEWIPDPLAGKMLYKLPENMPAKEVFKVMWEKGGATEEDPMPYLKTVLCRIVSIEDGWLVLLDTSNRSRVYGLSAKYRQSEIKKILRLHKPNIKISANNIRDIIRLFASKRIVEPVKVKKMAYPRYQLTETGIQLKKLLTNAQIKT